jgi:hypothetical protein
MSPLSVQGVLGTAAAADHVLEGNVGDDLSLPAQDSAGTEETTRAYFWSTILKQPAVEEGEQEEDPSLRPPAGETWFLSTGPESGLVDADGAAPESHVQAFSSDGGASSNAGPAVFSGANMAVATGLLSNYGGFEVTHSNAAGDHFTAFARGNTAAFAKLSPPEGHGWQSALVVVWAEGRMQAMTVDDVVCMAAGVEWAFPTRAPLRGRGPPVSRHARGIAAPPSTQALEVDRIPRLRAAALGHAEGQVGGPPEQATWQEAAAALGQAEGQLGGSPEQATCSDGADGTAEHSCVSGTSPRHDARPATVADPLTTAPNVGRGEASQLTENHSAAPAPHELSEDEDDDVAPRFEEDEGGVFGKVHGCAATRVCRGCKLKMWRPVGFLDCPTCEKTLAGRQRASVDLYVGNAADASVRGEAGGTASKWSVYDPETGIWLPWLVRHASGASEINIAKRKRKATDDRADGDHGGSPERAKRSGGAGGSAEHSRDRGEVLQVGRNRGAALAPHELSRGAEVDIAPGVAEDEGGVLAEDRQGSTEIRRCRGCRLQWRGPVGNWDCPKCKPLGSGGQASLGLHAGTAGGVY